jgi:sec-independent protein translocase protein TatC
MMTTDDADSPLADLLQSLRDSPIQNLLVRADELRSRMVKSMVVVAILFVACFALAQQILVLLEAPLLAALPDGHRTLNFTGPLDVFMCYVQVSFLLAFVLSAPVLFFHAWRFIAPGLPVAYRRFAVPYFVSACILFAAGLAFCYLVMMPMSLTYLIQSGGEVATPTIMIGDYVQVTVILLLAFGAVFQLPIVLVLLEELGIIGVEHLSGNRNIIVVVILIIAAIATPTPDPISQLAMAAPMYLMLEGAIVFIKLKNRRRAAAAPASSESQAS